MKEIVTFLYSDEEIETMIRNRFGLKNFSVAEAELLSNGSAKLFNLLDERPIELGDWVGKEHSTEAMLQVLVNEGDIVPGYYLVETGW